LTWLMKNRGSADVMVIGGGVIGLAIAWRAARQGMQVTLLERDRLGGGTSHLAAGMLAPTAEADPREGALLGASLASASAYPAFVDELAGASDAQPGYLRCGTLLVARDADEARALERELGFRQHLELPVRRHLATQTRRLEPGLSPTVRLGLEFSEDHVIDPRRLVAALATAAARAGAVLRTGAEVQALLVGSSGVEGVRLAGNEVLGARRVVIAAGPWSASIRGLPPSEQPPLRPVKGQILRLHDPSGPGLLTRVLRTVAGYVVPRGDGRYVLGATVEERGFDTSVSAGAVFELLRDAIELLPGLADLVIDELAAGLRPGTADNLPVIGPGGIEGLLWATGHYRHGILLAPLTADIVVAGLLGEETSEFAEAFSPRRFQALAVSA
jgi:glycine oxidase